MGERCPVCGTPGTTVSADEGTSYFRPAAPVALDDSAFTRTLRAYADRAHDNVSYRTLVPEVVLRDAAAVIDDYRARPAAPVALDVPEDRRVPIEPETPEAMALIQVGATTVKDDSGEICTLILGDVNSVGRRLATLAASPPPLRAAGGVRDALDRPNGPMFIPDAASPPPLDATTPDPATDDGPVGPVRIRSANCAAGDHGDCLGMVEQDVPELGITDCFCKCHGFAAEEPAEGRREALTADEVANLRRFVDDYPYHVRTTISRLLATLDASPPSLNECAGCRVFHDLGHPDRVPMEKQ